MKTEAKNQLDLPLKPRKLKSREVASRYLSPSSPSSTAESPISSPNLALSPTLQKNPSLYSREASLTRGLWPSATPSKASTLADHLGNERLIDFVGQKTSQKSSSKSNLFFTRQRSCSEFSRFQKDKEQNSKENRPIGGSMRFAKNFKFLEKSSSSSSSSTFATPGRFSVDGNSINRKKFDNLAEILSSESDRSEVLSSTDLGYPEIGKSRSRKAGMEVPSRFLRAARTPHSFDSSNPTTDNSPRFGKNLMGKRANSMTAYALAKSQWALSPGRTISPPMSAESNGKPIHSFSSSKPPSPTRSKTKVVGNFFSLGLDLFKNKKSSSPSSNSSLASFLSGGESHQLAILHNSLVQWRFVNARAEAVNRSKTVHAERTFLNAWGTLSNLQSSVARKGAQFEKEKLELKLNRVINSQLATLEAWGDMERQHVSAVSTIKECLHAVVCRVPITGSKADPLPISVALRHAGDLTASIKKTLSNFTPTAQKTVPLLSELAEVAARERTLLQELFELLGIVANLELQERSLRCHVLQLKSQQQLEQQAV